VGYVPAALTMRFSSKRAEHSAFFSYSKTDRDVPRKDASGTRRLALVKARSRTVHYSLFLEISSANARRHVKTKSVKRKATKMMEIATNQLMVGKSGLNAEKHASSQHVVYTWNCNELILRDAKSIRDVKHKFVFEDRREPWLSHSNML
jgi:hypothetical protein